MIQCKEVLRYKDTPLAVQTMGYYVPLITMYLCWTL